MKWPPLPSFLTSSAAAIPHDAPLPALPPHELEALEKLKEDAVPILRSAPNILSEKDPWTEMQEPDMQVLRDEMLLRFLRFNTLNVEKSLHQLRNVLSWRANSRIAELSTDAFHGMEVGIPVAQIGEVTADGDGLFFAPAECYDKKRIDHKAQEVGIAKMFEHMLYAADGPKLRRGTVVVDFEGFSVRNVDLSGLRTGVTIYTSYYPDLFQKVLLINYPKFMYGVWKAIAPLLDARTVSRVIWVSDGEALQSELEEVFSKKELPRWLGGEVEETRLTLMNGRHVEARDLTK